jgi:predicted amidohydrolase YtcJ
MNPPRADLVVTGQVVVAARPDGLERADAIGIAGERVVSTGSAPDVLEAARPRARVVDARDAAVVPGLNDFHLHLVGMARARRSVRLDEAASFGDLLARVRTAVRPLPPDAWLRGRGWSEAQLEPSRLDELAAVLDRRPALLVSHDGHSAWASPAALAAAGIDSATPDPAGGRIERMPDGVPNGILRERAMDAATRVAARLRGSGLALAVDETLSELSELGVTAATDAGDATTDNGFGGYAYLGDSFSSLAELASLIDGRLRLTLNLPVTAIGSAAAAGLHSGHPLTGTRTLRIGWAKAYTDGALGSGTAALFDPDSCGGGRGILRMSAEELDAALRTGREAGVALAMHAIGDRACAAVLDAVERAGKPRAGVPADRMEHAQLVRRDDRPRFAALGITASMQPIHAAADRERAAACWAGRLENAYSWRSLARAGALLAFGSDAPVEAVNPWMGLFAAVHRRLPGETVAEWTPDERLETTAALSAYTLGSARAAGRTDEGHLRPGARADLAVLDVDLPTLLAADERLTSVRSRLTMVAGREVYRA